LATNKNQMISDIFHERSQFIVIGLTGRTGSGCTTTASILEKEKPSFPNLSDITHNGSPFFNGLDAKKYELLSNYATENYSQFFSIKISDLISVYILAMNIDKIIKFVSSQTSSSNKNKIEKIFKKGVFSKTYANANKEMYKKTYDKLLNRDSKKKFFGNEIEKNEFDSFIKLIKKFTNKFKKELISIDNELYIKVYQNAGNSIRKIGEVDVGYKGQKFNPESVFHLPETINRMIKCIRNIRPEKAFIIIDAIRNPYEARFFKERYSAFYLVSINKPYENRKNIYKMFTNSPMMNLRNWKKMNQVKQI